MPILSDLYYTPQIFSTFSELKVGISTRNGGVSTSPFDSLNLGLFTADSLSAIKENRRRFFEALGVDASVVAESRQIHGSNVLHVNSPGNYEEYDSLVTNSENILLAITVADCAPVLIYDCKQGVIAAIHAGWKGTVKEIVPATLREMKRSFGSNPADCYAHIGVCIGKEAFEVDADVASFFPEKFRKWDEGRRKYLVDLKATLVAQLQDGKVPMQQIEVSPFSTTVHNNRFFSYRLEKGTTGRMLAVIGLQNKKAFSS